MGKKSRSGIASPKASKSPASDVDEYGRKLQLIKNPSSVVIILSTVVLLIFLLLPLILALCLTFFLILCIVAALPAVRLPDTYLKET
jgi:maltodextrin utilization protein YvdJ